MMMELIVEISVMAKLHLPEGEAALGLIMSTPGSDVLAGVLPTPSPKTISRQMLSAVSVMGIDVAVISQPPRLPLNSLAAAQILLIPSNKTPPARQILPSADSPTARSRHTVTIKIPGVGRVRRITRTYHYVS